MAFSEAGPFVKWAGGKTQLLDQLVQYVPHSFGQYIEPFVGGGALFFRLQASPAVLGDSNPELMHCYEIVRDDVESLIGCLDEYQRLHTESFYYSVRSSSPMGPLERAARFIYLNRTCYNGLYRVNKKGEFNVPMGRYQNPRILDASGLRAASVALQNSTLVLASYNETLKRHAKPGDLVYIDPPYHPVSKYSDFKRYTPESFYEADQVRLAETIRALAGNGCFVLASNSYSDFILELYRDFKIAVVPAKRFINKDPSKRLGAKEVIIVAAEPHAWSFSLPPHTLYGQQAPDSPRDLASSETPRV